MWPSFLFFQCSFPNASISERYWCPQRRRDMIVLIFEKMRLLEIVSSALSVNLSVTGIEKLKVNVED